MKERINDKRTARGTREKRFEKDRHFKSQSLGYFESEKHFNMGILLVFDVPKLRNRYDIEILLQWISSNGFMRLGIFL